MENISVCGIGLLRIAQATCNKRTSRFMDSMQRYLLYGCYFEAAAALFSFVYLLIVGFRGFSVATVCCAAISGVCFVAELSTSLEAMRTAPLAMCNLCALGGGIVLPSIAGIFFFDEPMSLWQWLGVVLFFAGVLFLSPSDGRRISLTVRAAVTLFGNFLINGLCATVGKYFAVRVENGNAALYSCLTYAIASLLFGAGVMAMLLRRCTVQALAEQLLPKPLFLYGLALGAVCSTICYFSTVLSRTVSVVVMHTVPSAISVIGCLYIGRLFFHEKIVLRQHFGVLLGILAAVLIVCF